MRRAGIALALCAVAVGCGGSSTTGPPRSEAEKLARLDADLGHRAAAEEYDRLLKQMDPRCDEDEHALAAGAWATQKEIAKGGRSDSILQVLRAGTRAAVKLPDNAVPTDCVALFAAYATLRD